MCKCGKNTIHACANHWFDVCLYFPPTWMALCSLFVLMCHQESTHWLTVTNFVVRNLTSCRWKCWRWCWQEHTCWPSGQDHEGCHWQRRRLSRLSSCPRCHQTGGRRWLVGLSLLLHSGSVIRYSECCVVRLSCSTAYTAVRMTSKVSVS